MWWRRRERLRQQLCLYRTLREYMTKEQARFVLQTMVRDFAR